MGTYRNHTSRNNLNPVHTKAQCLRAQNETIHYTHNMPDDFHHATWRVNDETLVGEGRACRKCGGIQFKRTPDDTGATSWSLDRTCKETK